VGPIGKDTYKVSQYLFDIGMSKPMLNQYGNTYACLVSRSSRYIFASTSVESVSFFITLRIF
jgi:hypothetical protein